MDKLLQSVKVEQTMIGNQNIYITNNWGLLIGFAVVFLSFIIFVYANCKNKTHMATASAIICLISLIVAYIYGISSFNSVNEIDQKYWTDFKQHQLLPYVEQHRQTYVITGYSCGKEKKSNVVNITKNIRVNVTAYFADEKGLVHPVSGDMVVYLKDTDKMTLQATKINKRITDDLGAGYYEPALTIPVGTGFTCGKNNTTDTVRK